MTRIEERIRIFVKERLGLSFFRLYSVVDNKSFTLNSLILEFIERERMRQIEDHSDRVAGQYEEAVEREEGRWTDPQTGNYEPVSQEASFISCVHCGKELKDIMEMAEHDCLSKQWFLTCSYVLPHATSRSLTNILLKQDHFPTIKECKQHIEEKTGFEVEEVVLMNWKEVNNDYEL